MIFFLHFCIAIWKYSKETEMQKWHQFELKERKKEQTGRVKLWRYLNIYMHIIFNVRCMKSVHVCLCMSKKSRVYIDDMNSWQPVKIYIPQITLKPHEKDFLRFSIQWASSWLKVEFNKAISVAHSSFHRNQRAAAAAAPHIDRPPI